MDSIADIEGFFEVIAYGDDNARTFRALETSGVIRTFAEESFDFEEISWVYWGKFDFEKDLVCGGLLKGNFFDDRLAVLCGKNSFIGCWKRHFSILDRIGLN